MEQKDHENEQALEPPDIPQFDDIRDLYIGPVEKASGYILTDRGNLRITVWGEILLYGHLEGDSFTVERLRQISLYGALEKPEEDRRIDVFSLAGPLNEAVIEPGSSGTVEGLIEQLHYGALTSELEPLIKSDDAVFPQVEQIGAKLTWEQAGKLAGNTVPIHISFVAEDLADKKLGIVQRITLDPVTLGFFLAGTGAPSPEPHHSLQSSCPAPPAGGCPYGAITRSVSLKFVNFSTTRTQAAVEALCNTQIQGLCEVWRNKAALQFTVQSTLIQALPPDPANYSTTTPTEEVSIGQLSYASTTQVEIYLVDQFTVNGQHGGGISYNSGQASAYCILSLSLMGGNPYLLAHEMGHVLGLSHPDGTAGLIDCSPGSIMEAATPNPNKNTLFNCRIFTNRPKTHNCTTINPQPPLNPMVSTPGAADCFRPDSVSHFIRDFPTDAGIEPSAPPPGQYVWNNSNLWNRKSDTPGTPTASGPAHEEPTASGTNYMHVKLENRTTLADPVTVELYLAYPGSSTTLRSLDPINHRLTFCPPPVAPNAVTKSLAWSVPPGCPPHCCAFAILSSDDEPSSVASPATATFASVAPLVPAKRGVAQRNLNIAYAGGAPLPMWIMLPWAQMDNPSGKKGPVHLEIDATQAALLQNLQIEMDGQIIGEITPGEIGLIAVAEELPRNEYKLLRLRALLPANPAVSTQIPIHMRFLMDQQVMNGYTHEVRITSISNAVLQVLGVLYCALRDVVIGCEVDQVSALPEAVRRIFRLEQLVSGESKGCLGLLLSIFRRKSAWRSDVARLSGGIAALALSLENKSEPECAVIRKYLFELAGLLQVPKDMLEPLFVEQIRDLADRIHEPAIRMFGRRKL